jgi:hypothetical protein
VNEEHELRIHLLKEELTQVLEAISEKHNHIIAQEQVGEYLGMLIESLKFFHEQGNWQRMEYDLAYAIAFLPSAFPI